MKRLLLLVILLLTQIRPGFSQIEFVKGYVLLNNGDTLYGEIDKSNYIRNSMQCNFRKEEGGEITTYFPNQIEGYRFINGKYYVSKKVPVDNDTIYVFLEYLINGKLNVFYCKNAPGSNHYYISNDTLPIVELEFSKDLKYNDGRMYYSGSEKAKGLLIYYTLDCPEMKERISHLETPNSRQLIQLSKYYQHQMYNDQRYIVYEKNAKPQLAILVSGGPYYFLRTLKTEDYQLSPNQQTTQPEDYARSGYSGRISFLFNLPEVNERIFLGVGYSWIIPEKNSFYRGLNISINYIHPKQNFSPYGSLGIDFNTIGLTYQGGIKYQKYKFSALAFAELNTKIPLIPYGLAARLALMYGF